MKKTNRWMRRADWVLWTFIALLPIFVWLLRLSPFPVDRFADALVRETTTTTITNEGNVSTSIVVQRLEPINDGSTEALQTFYDKVYLQNSLYRVMIDDFRMNGLTNDTATAFANPVYKALYNLDRNYLHIFGNFGNLGVLLYLTYFIMVSFLHIVTDVILFIPRFFLDFMDGD